MINIRVTQNDLFSGKPDETRTFVMDQDAFIVARQMIINRRVKYPGLDIELKKTCKIHNNNNLFVVECTRKSYGCSIDGYDEPKEYTNYDYTNVKKRRAARKEANEAHQQEV